MADIFLLIRFQGSRADGAEKDGVAIDFPERAPLDLLDRHVGAELLEYLLTGEPSVFDRERVANSTALLYSDLLRQGETRIRFHVLDRSTRAEDDIRGSAFRDRCRAQRLWSVPPSDDERDLRYMQMGRAQVSRSDHSR